MKELREKNDKELKEFVREKREELRKLRFSASGSGMRNAHVVRNLKKEIAQGLTEITKRAAEVVSNETAE